jgi:hypothetical protein
MTAFRDNIAATDIPDRAREMSEIVVIGLRENGEVYVGSTLSRAGTVGLLDVAQPELDMLA